MSGGPSVVFDKSFLQGLNVEEAGWFDNLFTTVITPLFFVETPADLEKEVAGGRTPEEVVGNIAIKAPVVSSMPTIHHLELCMAELSGHTVGKGRPYARAKWVKTGKKIGTRVDHQPEMEAFERWGNGDFLVVEREFAQVWRKSLTRFNAGRYFEQARRLGFRGKLKSLDEVMKASNDLAMGNGRQYATLVAICEMLDVPVNGKRFIVKRWKDAGNPPVAEFLPYCDFIFRINLFFSFGCRF
jgi:hypothetical protein